MMKIISYCFILLFFSFSFSLYSMEIEEGDESDISELYQDLQESSSLPVNLIFMGGMFTAFGAFGFNNILKNPPDYYPVRFGKRVLLITSVSITLFGMALSFYEARELAKLHQQYLDKAFKIGSRK